MLIEITLFIIGIILLIKGATWLVSGASSLAKKFGVSTLVIGLTVVAFGTSMPELVVNIIAALKGASGVAFGNIIGSNISNILLVLGVTAIIVNIKAHYSTVWKEIPFALLAVLVLYFLSNKIISGTRVLILNRTDGIIMLFFFGIFLYYANELIYASKAKNKKGEKKVKIKIKIPPMPNTKIFALIFAGMIALFLGGKWTVDGAVFIAQQFGLSQFLISATIIAIGTSLPELVTSIVAALKKDVDLAIGNIVGSNIFNILWILGLTSLISTIKIPVFINLDIVILLIVTLLLLLFMFTGKKYTIERKHGILFIILYIIYIIFLIMRG